MHVLRRLREKLVPGGIVLDLQVIRPNPLVESEGRVLCEIDGGPLFLAADAARAAVDLLVTERLLLEDAVDDHDVLRHYAGGAELVDDFAGRKRTLPAEMLPVLQGVASECVVRERCRLRLLRRVEPSSR